MDQQKSVDLSLEKEGKKTAIEIATSVNCTRELANIQKSLAAGYDRIIILCIDDKMQDSLKNRVKQQFNAETQGKLFIPHVNSLFPLI